MNNKELDQEFNLLSNKIQAYLALASESGLEVEVVTTALTYVKDTPIRYEHDLALAMADALKDWDLM